MYTFSIFETGPDEKFAYPIPEYEHEPLNAITVAEAQEEALQHLCDYADACDPEDGYTEEDSFWCVVYDAQQQRVASACLGYNSSAEQTVWSLTSVPCLPAEED